MKRLLIIISILISIVSGAQSPPPGFVGNPTATSYRALSGYGLFGMPQDTFTIPTADRMLRWHADKGDTTYIWSVLQQKWIIASGGGSSAPVVPALANFYLKDSSLSSNRNVNLNGFDLNFSGNGIGGPPHFRLIASGDDEIEAQNAAGSILRISNDRDDALIQYHDTGTQIRLGNGSSQIAYTAGTHTFNVPATGIFKVYDGIGNLLSIDVNNLEAEIKTNDNVGTSAGFSARALTGDVVNFNLSAIDAANSQVTIGGDAVSGAITYTADTHTFNGPIVQPFSTLTYGATTTWDMATGDDKILTLTGDANLVFTNAINGNQGTLIVVQDGTGGHSLTVPDEIITINSNPGDTTVLGFVYDGTVYYWATSAGGGGTSTIAGATDANIAGLVDADLLIFNTSDSKWHNEVMSGDVTINNSGLTAIGAGKVTDIMVNSVAWSKITSTPTTLSGYGITNAQPLDNDLTTIAGLPATTDNFIVSVASAWASRTPAQVKSTLALDNVENTALSTWAGSTNITALGTIGTGTWQGGVISSTYGGTGVNNGGRTLTINTNSGTIAFQAASKTVTFANSMVFAGTDATTMNFPSTTQNIVGETFTQTLSNKTLIAPVISSIVNTGTLTLPTVTGTIMQYAEATISSNATWSPAGDARINFYDVTAQAGAATTISNPSGSAANHNFLYIRVKDNGTARALTWSGTQWRASPDLPLPTTTIVNKTMVMEFWFNGADTKWDFLGYLNNL